MHYVITGMRKTSYNKKKMWLLVKNKILLVCNSKYLLGQEQGLCHHRRAKDLKQVFSFNHWTSFKSFMLREFVYVIYP